MVLSSPRKSHAVDEMTTVQPLDDFDSYTRVTIYPGVDHSSYDLESSPKKSAC